MLPRMIGPDSPIWGSEAGLIRLYNRRRAPLAKLRILHHSHTITALITEDEAPFGGIEQNDALRLNQGFSRDAFARLVLEGFEFVRQRADSVVQFGRLNGHHCACQTRQHQNNH